MNKRLLALVSVLGVLVAACQPQGSPKAPPPSVPQAWIDAPLADAALPLAPYVIMSHAASPKGIFSFEFSVNGQVQQTSPVSPSQAGQTLAQMNETWNPPAVGTFLLSVRASDPAGAFGPPAEVRVQVGELATTPRPAGIATPSPTGPGPTVPRAALTATGTPVRPSTSIPASANTPTRSTETSTATPTRPAPVSAATATRPPPPAATSTSTRPQPRTATPTPTLRLIILPLRTPTRTPTPIPPPR